MHQHQPTQRVQRLLYAANARRVTTALSRPVVALY